jgi:hypothetical protein
MMAILSSPRAYLVVVDGPMQSGTFQAVLGCAGEGLPMVVVAARGQRAPSLLAAYADVIYVAPSNMSVREATAIGKKAGEWLKRQPWARRRLN